MSAEMAISPASLGRLRDSEVGEVNGNDNTSVALFWLRNWRFNERTAALLVSSTFTWPGTPTAFRARNTKRLSASSFNPATFFCRITKSLSLNSSLVPALQPRKRKQEGPVAALPPDVYGLSLGFRRRRLLFVGSSRRLFFDARCVSMPGFGQQEHLLLADARLVLAVGADDAPPQGMPHPVCFSELA